MEAFALTDARASRRHHYMITGNDAVVRTARHYDKGATCTALEHPEARKLCQLTLQGAKYGWTQAEIYKRAWISRDRATARNAASRLMKKDVDSSPHRRAWSTCDQAHADNGSRTLLDKLEANIVGAEVKASMALVTGFNRADGAVARPADHRNRGRRTGIFRSVATASPTLRKQMLSDQPAAAVDRAA